MARAVRERGERARRDAPRARAAGRVAAGGRQRPRRGRTPASAASNRARRRPRGAPGRGAGAGQAALRGRRCRDGAGHGPSHSRPPRRAARPARRRAGRRPGARPGAARAQADTGAAATDPGRHPRGPRPGRDARRRPAAAAPGLLRHQRLRDRAHLRPRATRLAADGDRVAPLSPHPRRERQACAARAPDRGRGLRALPAPRVPRPEAILHRGPRRDGADARRGDRALGRRGRPRGRPRHGPPRAPERARPRARPPLRDDPARVRRRAHARGSRRRPRGRHR